jgi:large subunit ribosomal protein L4
MKIKNFDKKGKTSGESTIIGSQFDIEPNIAVLSQYNYVILSNKRYSNAKAKDRSEVRGGGKKPWKQKGTGRARHGSTRSPIWRKGGVTFGPDGLQNYKKEIPKKVRKLAFKSSVALKSREEALCAIDRFDISKTVEALSIIKNMGLDGKKVTFIQTNDSNLHLYFRNISKVNFVRIGEVSAHDIMNGGQVILLSDVIEEFNKLGE